MTTIARSTIATIRIGADAIVIASRRSLSSQLSIHSPLGPLPCPEATEVALKEQMQSIHIERRVIWTILCETYCPRSLTQQRCRRFFTLDVFTDHLLLAMRLPSYSIRARVGRNTGHCARIQSSGNGVRTAGGRSGESRATAHFYSGTRLRF
jgi:hypothetical protein